MSKRMRIRKLTVSKQGVFNIVANIFAMSQEKGYTSTDLFVALAQASDAIKRVDDFDGVRVEWIEDLAKPGGMPA